MSSPRLFVMILCLSFFFLTQLSGFKGHTAATLETKDEAKALFDSFMLKIVQRKVEPAFKSIERNFPISEEKFKRLTAQAVSEMNFIESRFGLPLDDYVFVKEKEIQDTLIQYIYLEKFDFHILRWIFVIYRPEEFWVIQSINWDMGIDELFGDDTAYNQKPEKSFPKAKNASYP